MGTPIELARGDVDGTDASARAMCRAALRARAFSMIAVHNHPSGDPTPSCADVAVTRHLAAAGRTIDVPLVDHVVVCPDGRFTSLRQEQPEIWTSLAIERQP
jgi:DNA repair protein RadC